MRILNIKSLGILSEYRIDLLLAVVLGLMFAFFSFQRANLIPTVVFEGKYLDIWFESDCPRVYKAMTDRNADHSRSKVHPLFALVAYPPVYVLRTVFGLEPVSAVRFFISMVGFFWMGAFFVLFRLIGCPKIDSVLLCLTAGLSAAGMFFFVVPETYPLGSLSLLIALIFVVLTQKHRMPDIGYIFVNVVTVSITTTNWMLGIMATLLNHRWKKVLRLIGGALLVVGILWGLEKAIFPTTSYFWNIAGEKSFINRPESVGPLNVAWSIFYHTMIMPALRTNTDSTVPGWSGLITQPSLPASGSLWGIGAAILWTVILGVGIWALVTLSVHKKLRIVLVGMFVGQFGLHFLYGFETFLYSLHFLVLLMMTISLTFLTKFRIFVRVPVIIFIVCSAVNNTIQFDRSLDFIRTHYRTDIQ